MPETHKPCQSHCCALHGCKYGYEDCPVAMQRLEQDYYCERCPTLEELQAQQKELNIEFTHWEKINDRKTKEVIAEHRAKLKAKKEKDVR